MSCLMMDRAMNPPVVKGRQPKVQNQYRKEYNDDQNCLWEFIQNTGISGKVHNKNQWPFGSFRLTCRDHQEHFDGYYQVYGRLAIMKLRAGSIFCSFQGHSALDHLILEDYKKRGTHLFVWEKRGNIGEKVIEVMRN